MKKVVRILGLSALMAFAFTACNKNNNGKVAIKASMPETTSDSKTYLDGDWVKWSNYDEILVFDKQSTESENHVWLEVEGGQHTRTATFYGAPDFFSHLETEDNSYTAFYPVASETLITADSVCLVIPDEQNYALNNSFATNTYPMYAQNIGNQFTFTSPAGLLTIPVKIADGSSESFTISEIQLIVNYSCNPIAGALKYDQKLTDKDGDGIPDYKVETGERTITLKDIHATLSHGVTYFNFVILEGALEANFRINLIGESGMIATCKGKIPNDPGPGYIVAKKRTMMPTIELPAPPEP